MPAAGVHFAHVNFTQTVAEAFQNQLGFGHGRVYLPGVPYVKTQPGFRKLPKQALQVQGLPADGFSFVHVFNEQHGAQHFPGLGRRNDIRMNNNWYSAIHDGAQPIENLPLLNDREVARCVKGNELEASEIETGERVH